MKKQYLFLLGFLGFLASAQNTTSLGIWDDHIPQSKVYDLVKANNNVYCATEIGLFVYNDGDQSLTTYSKLNGMSDIGVRALAYDHKRNVLLMGYKNGNLDIFDGENIRNINDIFRTTKYTGRKNINDIFIQNDVAYISTGFGIVELSLTDYIILNTYIIGEDATEVEVFEVDIDSKNNAIYAATNKGLLKANLNDPLIFYQSWVKETGLPTNVIFTEVDVFGEYVFTNTHTGAPEDSVFVYDGNQWSYFTGQQISTKSDIRAENGYLGIVSAYGTSIYNPNLSERYFLSGAFFPPNQYQPYAVFPDADGKTYWISNWGYGLVRSVEVGASNKRILPNGPHTSAGYSLTVNNQKVFVSTGAIDEVWTGQYMYNGIYEYMDYDWFYYPSEEMDNIRDIVNITVDPTNSHKWYANAWGRGVYEITDGVVDTLWNHISTNGVLQPATGSGTDDIRTGGSVYDKNGDLWITNALVQKPLVVKRKDGTWENFSLGSFSSTDLGFKDILINELGQIWMQSRNKGLVVVEFVNGNPIANGVSNGLGKGNLPSDGVLSMAEDEDGEMWIGTDAGLVVLYSPENIFTNNSYDAQPILFEEEGVVQKLLGTEQVTAIAIDGANKKWFGTQNSGVFYTSQDGTETIHHFTIDNSPLLSNAILDIALDEISGEVYFLTAEGIVSYRGSATAGNDDYNNVYAYPNPVRPGYEGPIFIRGLVTNAQVKITDAQGNIVSDFVAEGGQAVWYGRDLNGNKVATGVYLAYITNDDGSLVATTKILLVN